MGLKVRLCGVRGSLPSPYSPAFVEKRISNLFQQFFEKGHQNADQVSDFLKSLTIAQYGGYGGNTPCVEVRSPNAQMIIDGGTGLRTIGIELLAGPCGKGAGEAHIFMTHFHWDHLMGLPFFIPIFIPGNKIHMYAVQPELPDLIKNVFRKPYFPVPFEALGAQIIFHPLEPRKVTRLGDLQITPYQLDHPDPCWGYRVEHGGRVYAHCVDTECTRVSQSDLGPDLPLYQGVDLMVFDGQYTLMEAIEKMNWGHAAATLGLDIAMREGIRKIAFIHHDPASSDEKVAMAEAQTRRYYNGQLKQARRAGPEIKLHEVEWFFAHEGLTLDV